MALPSVPQEKAQGAVLAEQQLAQGAPPPLEPSPAQADEQAAQAVAESVAQSAPVAQPAQQTPAAQQPPRPNMWRIPTDYSKVMGQNPRSLPEQLQAIGSLWGVLASDPKVDPLVRAIAESLVRGR